MLTVDIAGLALPVSRLLMILAAIVAWITAALVGRRERRAVGDVLWRMLWVGLLAARAAFVIQYFEAYREHPLSIVDIRDGGFTVWFGILAALFVGTWSAARRPALRRPLMIAVSAGAITWGGTSSALLWLNHQSRAVPQIRLQALDGGSTSLKALSGQPMVVNLWASWCPPCRREMPILEQAQERYEAVTFVFVNQGEAASAIREYIQNMNLELANVLLDPHRKLGHHIGSTLLPTTLFYNTNGVLVDTHLGMLSRATLRSNLAQFSNVSSPDG